MGDSEERRAASASVVVKWVGLAVGLCSIVGVLVGAGISYGQHVRADEEQDKRLTSVEDRVRDLERAERYEHGDTGQLPRAPRGGK